MSKVIGHTVEDEFAPMTSTTEPSYWRLALGAGLPH